MPVRRLSRRKLLASALAGAAGVGLAWLLGRIEQARALPGDAIRPPGALPEAEFLAACIRCGLCVRACPFDTLRLADLGEAVPVGTPYFVARALPCEMCRDIPCRAACPTGALSPALADIGAARMGTAALSAPQSCYSWTGQAYCDSCVRACPVGKAAITLHPGRTAGGGGFAPTVDPEHCTGCGKCEHACVLERAAIAVQARHAD